MAYTSGTLRVRDDAPKIKVGEHGTVVVGGHTNEAEVSGPAHFETRTAGPIRETGLITDPLATIIVRRGPKEIRDQRIRIYS